MYALLSRGQSWLTFSRFITWGIITTIVLVTGIINFFGRRPASGGRAKRSLGVSSRRFLPQSLYGLFPRVTRLQTLMALLLVLYCVVFGFVGIPYRRPRGVSRVCVCAVCVCAVVVGQCIFARDGHLVSALQLCAPPGWPLHLWYDMGAHAAVVGRARLRVSAAAGKSMC